MLFLFVGAADGQVKLWLVHPGRDSAITALEGLGTAVAADGQEVIAVDVVVTPVTPSQEETEHQQQQQEEEEQRRQKQQQRQEEQQQQQQQEEEQQQQQQQEEEQQQQQQQEEEQQQQQEEEQQQQQEDVGVREAAAGTAAAAAAAGSGTMHNGRGTSSNSDHASSSSSSCCVMVAAAKPLGLVAAWRSATLEAEACEVGSKGGVITAMELAAAVVAGQGYRLSQHGSLRVTGVVISPWQQLVCSCGEDGQMATARMTEEGLVVSTGAGGGGHSFLLEWGSSEDVGMEVKGGRLLRRDRGLVVGWVRRPPLFVVAGGRGGPEMVCGGQLVMARMAEKGALVRW